MEPADRPALVRSAIRWSAASVAWAALAGGTALVAGALAGSLALVGFGLDSIVDGSASVVLIWRFRVEASDPERAEHVEHLAHRAVAVVLALVALYLTVQAIRALVAGDAPHSTVVGTVIAAASLVVLPALAVAKYRVAGALGSRALRGDAVLSGAGALLSLFTLASLALDHAFGWWWADAVAALLTAAVLAREVWNGRGGGTGREPLP